jgi:hypothetical protein
MAQKTSKTTTPKTDKHGQIFTETGRRSPNGGFYLPPSETGFTKPVRKNSKRHLWLQSLSKGATIAQQAKASTWSEGTVRSGIRWAVNAELGYGVQAAANEDSTKRIYQLVFPKGQSEITVRVPKAKVVKTKTTKTAKVTKKTKKSTPVKATPAGPVSLAVAGM